MKAESRNGWELQQSGTTSTLRGIAFTDANTGTVVGESSTILRTTNGGENWSAQHCNLSVHFLDVSFSSETTGVACGTLGTIIYTTDAGATWITHQTGWLMQYYGAHMESSLIGILVGENSIFSPMVTWTLDGWQSHTTKGFLLNNNEGQLWDVQYSSSTTWYAAANVWDGEGAIARTTDGGSNWQTIYWADRGFFGMDFPSSTIGYAVGRAGIIVKTTDGGNTWNFLSSGVATTLLDVSFATEACGTVVGQNGLILRTEDGGSTWVPQGSGTTSDLYAVQCITSQIGFAVGKNGVILHTMTGGYPVDTEPPVTTCRLQGTMNGSIYTSAVNVTLSAVDNESGVNYTQYKIDGGPWTNYTGQFVISSEGNHSIVFYSVDNAGNKERDKTTTFTIRFPIQIIIKGGLGITATITNTGKGNLTNLRWKINLSGGLIIVGKSKSGIIALLQAGEEATAKDFVLGFGKTTITVTAGETKTTATGTQFFVFSIVKQEEILLFQPYQCLYY